MAGHPALPSLSAGTLKHRSEGHPSEVPPPHPKLAKAVGSGGASRLGGSRGAWTAPAQVRWQLGCRWAWALRAGTRVPRKDSWAAGVATRLHPPWPSGPHAPTTCPGWKWRVTQATGQTQAQSPTGPPVAGQTPGHRLSRRPSSCTADRPAPGEGLSSLSRGTSSRLPPPQAGAARAPVQGARPP